MVKKRVKRKVKKIKKKVRKVSKKKVKRVSKAPARKIKKRVKPRMARSNKKKINLVLKNLVLFVILFIGCSSTSVNQDYNANYDFSKLKTSDLVFS